MTSLSAFQEAKSKDTKPATIKIIEGHQLKIHCKADGNPLPKIDWFRNGEKIIPEGDHNINVEIKEKKSALIISKVKIRHSGNYSCIAHNSNGKLSKWIYVTVLEKTSDVTTSSELLTSSPLLESSTTTSAAVCSKDNCIHGSCVQDNNNSMFCRCHSMYTGVRCDTLIQNNNRSEPCITFQTNKDFNFPEGKMFALIGFGLSIILILLILSLLCFYKFKRKRNPYILGEKCRKVSNKAIQVSEIIDFDEKKFPMMPDNISNSFATEAKCPDDVQSIYSPSKIDLVTNSLFTRGPPSGESSSSHDNCVPSKNILLSVNDIPYTILNTCAMSSAFIPNPPSQPIIQLRDSSPYLYSTLKTNDNLSLNRYMSNLIPISFTCNDPCCCLNAEPKQISAALKIPQSMKPNISVHPNPFVTCNYKADVKTINTYV